MKLLSFGEVLWDVFPDSKHIGGAALNFAAHFAKLGGQAWMATAVGADEYGTDAMRQLEVWNLRTDFVAVDPRHETGKCLVTLNQQMIPSYNLLSDVAYDYIPLPQVGDQKPDVLYFGTLALRGSHNLAVVKQMVESKLCGEVFVDINIRPPFYSEETIRFALSSATIVKISDEELPVVLKNIGMDPGEDWADAAMAFSRKFDNLKLILITLGEKGAYVYDCRTGQEFSCPAQKVQVVSTVGAGDSFGAAFMARYLQGKDVLSCMEFASKISAFVVSKTGAVPDYNPEDFE